MEKLAAVTEMRPPTLRGAHLASTFAVAEKMAWASRRETTREEDIAYFLIGLFGVNMPILYGEAMTWVSTDMILMRN